MDGQKDRWTDQQMDGQKDGWILFNYVLLDKRKNVSKRKIQMMQ